MTASTTIGLESYLTKASATPVALVPTAISKAKPAEVTVAASTGVVAGDVVYMANTGFKELDGQYFIAGTVAATSIDLVGSDTTASTGTLAATPELVAYPVLDMVKMCLATVDPASEAAGTTSVGTYCDPSATVPSVSQAGTLTMTGFVDNQAYYEELNLAAFDGVQRILNVVLPQGLGNIVVPATLSSIGWQLPVDGAIGFTTSGAMGTKPRHRF
jgi:hypothetical protein